MNCARGRTGNMLKTSACGIYKLNEFKMAFKRLFCNFYSGLENSNKSIEKCEDTKILKVAMIGIPNSGKSTLINQLIKRRVFAISKKVHTTKTSARAVFNEGHKQIVFLDTPGLVSLQEVERFKLNESFMKGEEAISEADVIGIVHDISIPSIRNHLDSKILRLLHLYQHKESFLVLNKIDTIKSKRELLEVSKKLTNGKLRDLNTNLEQQKLTESEIQKLIKKKHNWEFFSEVFMVSALLSNGVDRLRDYLLAKAYPSKWIFPAESFTDKNPVSLIEEIVRSKLLDYLPQEIPYNLDVQLEYLDMDKEELYCAAVSVFCPSEKKVRLIAGTRGKRIQMIAAEAEQELCDIFLTDFNLKIALEIKETKENGKSVAIS